MLFVYNKTETMRFVVQCSRISSGSRNSVDGWPSNMKSTNRLLCPPSNKSGPILPPPPILWIRNTVTLHARLVGMRNRIIVFDCGERQSPVSSHNTSGKSDSGMAAGWTFRSTVYRSARRPTRCDSPSSRCCTTGSVLLQSGLSRWTCCVSTMTSIVHIWNS